MVRKPCGSLVPRRRAPCHSRGRMRDPQEGPRCLACCSSRSKATAAHVSIMVIIVRPPDGLSGAAWARANGDQQAHGRADVTSILLVEEYTLVGRGSACCWKPTRSWKCAAACRRWPRRSRAPGIRTLSCTPCCCLTSAGRSGHALARAVPPGRTFGAGQAGQSGLRSPGAHRWG
jgi:hypothetical protein